MLAHVSHGALGAPARLWEPLGPLGTFGETLGVSGNLWEPLGASWLGSVPGSLRWLQMDTFEPLSGLLARIAARTSDGSKWIVLSHLRASWLGSVPASLIWLHMETFEPLSGLLARIAPRELQMAPNTLF